MIRTYSFPRIDRVVHGPGAVHRLPRLLDELGRQRAMVLTGRSLATTTSLVDALVDELGSRHAGTFSGLRQHAPAVDVAAAADAVREAGADVVIAYGGSSVTDAAKIVAVQVLGPQRPQADLPLVLVPTTLSSGEYTPAAGMTGDVPGVKTYVADPRMAPYAVILDPEVTLPTPMSLWLSTGIKSVDHACEVMWGPRPHPFTDTLALEALRRLPGALRATLADPTDLTARLDAQLSGWMSMAGIVNVNVYLSHALGHQIGARWDVPHGYTSGITLPPVMQFLAADSPAAVAAIAAALGAELPTGAPADHAAAAGAEQIRQLVEELGLPTRLRDVGADRADFPSVASATVTAAQALGMTRPLADSEVEGLLDSMW